MLSENENVISFCAGSVKNGQVTLGRIVVHDRIKVENEILPRYFNHSSFASLRRQLNYFSFTRIGKGRQKGATYCNEGVIAIEDILRLRRRSTTGVSSGSVSEGSGVSGSNRSVVTKAVSLSPKRVSMSIVSQRNNKSKREIFESALQQSCLGSQQPVKKVRLGAFNNTKGSESALRIAAPSNTPTLVSPITSPLHTPSTSPSDTLQVSLDLTKPTESQILRTNTLETKNEIAATMISSNSEVIQQAHWNRSYLEDPDILAGCRALLSFSHGLRSLTA